MDTSWKETQAKLVSIQQEYNLICQAWKATSNSEREQQLRDLASACLAEVQATVQHYGGTKERAVGESVSFAL